MNTRLNRLEISQLRDLMQSPQYKTLMRASADYIYNIQNSYSENQEKSQWDFIKNSLLREGKVRGIQDFFHDLDKCILEND